MEVAELNRAVTNGKPLDRSDETTRTPVKRKGLFVLRPYWFERVYAPEDRQLLRSRVDIPDQAFTPVEVRENPELLRDVELLFSGWDGGKLDTHFLDAAPHLKAVFFGGGSVRNYVTEAFWERDIILTSAAPANAVPVAEFTFAQIILALKQAWPQSRDFHLTQESPQYVPGQRDMPGAYQTTIGIVSLGHIGRRVREMLRMLDVHVLAYDPFVSEGMAAKLDVELVSLDELFRRSEVVSIHTPLLAETEGFITGNLISKMKAGAALINTARGAIINEPQLIDTLRQRPDLTALLDVTARDPLEKNSPLFSMPNIFLTPHIAGSLNRECRRMGRSMIEEAERFLNGAPLRWVITQQTASILA
jgi:phosphoglycerate dehydrogenase-like enzyme